MLGALAYHKTYRLPWRLPRCLLACLALLDLAARSPCVRLLGPAVLALSLWATPAASQGELDQLGFPEAASAPPPRSCVMGAPAPAEPDAAPAPVEAPTPGAGSRRLVPPLASAHSLPAEQDLLARAHPDGTGRLRLSGPDGERLLTIQPSLQDALTQVLENYQTPYAAVVVLEPATGRVLAMAEHAQANRALRGLTTKALFPSGVRLQAGDGHRAAGCGPRPGRRRLRPRRQTPHPGTASGRLER